MAITPGPWTINGSRLEANSHIAFGTPGVYGIPVAMVLDDPLVRPQLADNLRLLSAAPDLYEALVMVRDADDDCHRDGLRTIPPPARARIDAAIAKAEGADHAV